jgi:hypothetical protein
MIPPDSNPNPQAKADGSILMMGRAQILDHPDKSDHTWKIVDGYGNKYCIVCLIYVDPDEEWDYGYYKGPALDPALNPPDRATIRTKSPTKPPLPRRATHEQQT